MTPDDYCQQKTASSGSSFYYSFLFLPPERRRALTALYAFCREVDDIVDECREPQVARAKLNWWREDIERAFHGVPQHPVNQALAAAKDRYPLNLEYFQEIIDGMEMDLDRQHYESFRDLSLYCYRVASCVGLLSVEIFGYEDRNTLKYAHQLGMAFQLTNILRDVAEDAARGRIYLPRDEMREYGVTEQDLRAASPGEPLRRLFAFWYQRTQEYYDKAFALLPARDRYAQRSGLIMAAVYHALLEEIRRRDYDVLSGRVRLPAWKKLWLVWSTARREKWRHLQAARAGS